MWLDSVTYSDEHIVKMYMFWLSAFCYERIKTEQGWSSNQFAMHASEYSA